MFFMCDGKHRSSHGYTGLLHRAKKIKNETLKIMRRIRQVKSIRSLKAFKVIIPKFIATMLILCALVASNKVLAQATGYHSSSKGGQNADRWVINENNSEYWSYLRLQSGTTEAWNIANEGSLKWRFSSSSDHYDVGLEKMKLENNGNLSLGGNIRGNQSGGTLRIQSDYGYTDIGAVNAGYSHFYTDRPQYYFNKRIIVDEGIISSYNENLQLQTAFSTKMTILNLNGNVGINTSTPTEKLDVNGTARLRGVTQSDAQSRVLVSDANGKVFWREGTTLGADNLGNHKATQDIKPDVDNTHDLGSQLSSFKDIYFDGKLYYDGYVLLHAINFNSYFMGFESGENVTTGTSNTGIGHQTLRDNTSGSDNTAGGHSALIRNTSGNRNTAHGSYSLRHNTSGNNNTASGYNVLYSNYHGNNNSATGSYALNQNTTGSQNTAIGYSALFSNTTGNYNTAVGYSAGPAAQAQYYYLENTTAIGNNARVTASNQVRIGNSSVTSIGGQVSWSTLSDGRFKQDLKEDVSGLGFINKLRPVSYTVDTQKLNTFLGKEEQEVTKIAAAVRAKGVSRRQTGFVAQEVEKVVKEANYVFNGVEAPKNEGDHYSIRYAEFVVPLTKAVQELSAMVEAQKEAIEKQQQQINTLLANKSEEKAIDNVIDGQGGIQLFQNYPNPFTLDTKIEMELPVSVSEAKVLVYNLEGKEVKSLPISRRGKATVRLMGGELEAGIYIYTLIADGKVVNTRRMILTK
jgi:trimeric autotransporter adhesin